MGTSKILVIYQLTVRPTTVVEPMGQLVTQYRTNRSVVKRSETMNGNDVQTKSDRQTEGVRRNSATVLQAMPSVLKECNVGQNRHKN